MELSLLLWFRLTTDNPWNLVPFFRLDLIKETVA
jgi:hypothetical protein